MKEREERREKRAKEKKLRFGSPFSIYCRGKWVRRERRERR